jgi:hypothetical protein
MLVVPACDDARGRWREVALRHSCDREVEEIDATNCDDGTRASLDTVDRIIESCARQPLRDVAVRRREVERLLTEYDARLVPLRAARPSAGWVAAPAATLYFGLVALIVGGVMSTDCSFNFFGASRGCRAVPLYPVTSALVGGGLAGLGLGAIGMILFVISQNAVDWTPGLLSMESARQDVVFEDQRLTHYQRRLRAEAIPAPAPAVLTPEEIDSVIAKASARLTRKCLSRRALTLRWKILIDGTPSDITAVEAAGDDTACLIAELGMLRFLPHETEGEPVERTFTLDLSPDVPSGI